MSSGSVKITLLTCVLLRICSFCIGQTNISGTINSYSAVTFIGPCPNKITVADGSLFAAGNTVILIQMQGATINETNTSSFGAITLYNNSGFWEKAIVLSVAGNIVSLSKNLLNSYDYSAGKVQLIKVPTYTDATVVSTLTGTAWNGTSGGVIALEVSGTLLLNSDINASGIGFRGGTNTQVCANGCNGFTNENAYYYPIGDYRGAPKGEGIAAIITGKELGRGAQANGGGGGNDHNNGGGGGANYSIGGLGGNNADPGGFTTCKGMNNYGRPGNALNYASLNKLYFGGGGGAGHGDDGPACGGPFPTCTGGNGGGIVIIIAGTFNGNGHTILADGTDGETGWGDGGGGGGAGGAIFLAVGIYTNNLTLNVTGGNGGSTENNNQNRCFGPGAGGGAGIVLCNAALPGNVTSLMTGGVPGVVNDSSNGCEGSSTTATVGANSSTPLTGVVIPQSVSGPNAGCGLPVNYIYFSGKRMQDKIMLNWATATEYDASHFAIERSSDNYHFDEIDTVRAMGYSNSRVNYSFLDQHPYPGRNYYRLRQVDFTGYQKLTNVLMIDLLLNELVKNYYPNPVQSGTELILEFRDPEWKHQMRLIDISGRTVMQWIKPGNNQIAERVMIPKQMVGVYLLEISTAEKKQVIKITIQ